MHFYNPKFDTTCILNTSMYLKNINRRHCAINLIKSCEFLFTCIGKIKNKKSSSG